MDEIIDDFRENPKSKYGVLFKALWFLYGFIALIGYLFMAMHWPGVFMIVILGFALLSGHLIVHGIYKSSDVVWKITCCFLPLLLFFKVYAIFGFNPSFIPVYLGVFILSFCISFLIRK